MKKIVRKSLLSCLSLAIMFGILLLQGDLIKFKEKNSFFKISRALALELESVDSYEKVPVSLWLKDVDHEKIGKIAAEKCGVDYDEIFSGKYDADEVQNYIEVKRSISRTFYNELNKSFASSEFKSNEIIGMSEYSPVVWVELNKEEIESIAKNSRVDEIHHHNTNFRSMMDVSTELIEADKVRDEKSFTGAGVKIGMLDQGVPNLTDPMLSPIQSDIHIRPGDVTIDSHATLVASILVGQEYTKSNGIVVEGVAPDATLYCADVRDDKCFTGTEWLLSQGVNVINMSVTFGNDGLDTYGATAKWLDHIAVNHDVHVVISSGNERDPDYDENGITSGAMSFNAVTVGSVNDKNTLSKSDDFLSFFSSFYSKELTANETSKPDLCAYGQNITSASNTGSGTSFSAPQVSGVIAQICQMKPGLKGKQDVVKAILVAAVDDETSHKYLPGSSGYQAYGAGIVNSYNCWYTTMNGKYASSYFTPSESVKNISMYVSPTDTLMRVSLAYIKIVKYTSSNHISNMDENDYPVPNTECPLANLDLEVYDPNGNLVATCNRVNTNVEIVEFVPTVSGNYTIKIKQVTPSTVNAYFGVAWY